jgi:GDP/UDP-N,N'-diacetylbacillosamine 2-epimerase (hydrolysing)
MPMSRSDPGRSRPRRICVITGARADYGLLFWLLREIESDPRLELQLAVTGMHLEKRFGRTVREIRRDGFRIASEVPIRLVSDTPAAVANSMGMATAGFARAFAKLRPDIIVVLGDRFEIFAAAAAAVVACIPLAHIHGGETTEGAIDEAFRHSLTKMSHVHFAAAEAYRGRIIQMGEDPRRVHTVGALGLDNIRKLGLLGRRELEGRLGIRLARRNLLVTFHPATLEAGAAAAQFRNLLAALGELDDCALIFTMPNADPGGRALFPLVEAFVAEDPGSRVAFDSMGSLFYLSAMAAADAVVGNSSSGILEAPSLKIATLNIGDRQRGRLRAASVVDCGTTLAQIRGGLRRIQSAAFRRKLEGTISPYGRPGASRKIAKILAELDLDGLVRKPFHDLPGSSGLIPPGSR